jgi:hypothetical protein
MTRRMSRPQPVSQADPAPRTRALTEDTNYGAREKAGGERDPESAGSYAGGVKRSADTCAVTAEEPTIVKPCRRGSCDRVTSSYQQV